MQPAGEDQLAEARLRADRIEREFAAFRARRSVRAAVAVADTAYAVLRRLRSGTRPAPAASAPPSSDPGPAVAQSPRSTLNTGKWEGWYADVEAPRPYDDTETYRMGAEFLSDCSTVEDWGCGMGWMRNFIPTDRYVGVDGSFSRFADRVADLETYMSDVDGIFMRHVLEHNYHWERILQNALASFRRRIVLVTFTPYGDETREIAFHEDPGVPDISFAKQDLTKHFAGLKWHEETLATDTQYGTETVYFIERMPKAGGGRAEDLGGHSVL